MWALALRFNVWFKARWKRRLRFDIITAVIQFTQIKNAKWNHRLSVVWGIWVCLKREGMVLKCFEPWDGMGIKTLKHPYRIPKQVLGNKMPHLHQSRHHGSFSLTTLPFSMSGPFILHGPMNASISMTSFNLCSWFHVCIPAKISARFWSVRDLIWQSD